MRIPLYNRLKKAAHKKIAALQDEITDVTYTISPNAVFHGGTAIWRCYNGNRFSEDLDFYLTPKKEFENMFLKETESRGLEVIKYKKTENTIFSKIKDNETEVRFEVALRKKDGIVKSYEKLDGTSMEVFTLPIEELITEKISAYKNRLLVRDIYDVYFLSSLEATEKTKNALKELAKNIEAPLDEKNLKTIVYAGAIPSFKQMVEAIKRRC
jgi:predicted nucleotidyltransferase component of viral defense system